MRFSSLLAVGLGAARLGDGPRGARLLLEARALAQEGDRFEGRRRAEELLEVAVNQREAGLVDAAALTASEAEKSAVSTSDLRTLAELARFYREAHDAGAEGRVTATAEAAAPVDPDPSAQAAFVRELVRFHLGGQWRQRALELARGLVFPDFKTSALLDVGVADLEGGDRKAALEIASEALRPARRIGAGAGGLARGSVLLRIGAVRIDARDVQGCLETLAEGPRDNPGHSIGPAER